MKYPVPFTVCVSRLECGTTQNASINILYKWRVGSKDYGLEDLRKCFFARDQVLRLLRDYTIFCRMDDALQKCILRSTRYAP